MEEIDLPQDRAGYARRACPRCRADFKVRASRRDERVLAFAMARRVNAFEAGEAVHPPPPRHCPYCGARDVAEAFWTREQHSWVEAQARGVSEEVRWRRLCAPLDRLAENPRLTYVPIPPGTRVPAPTRDDVDALRAMPLPCCGEEEKVSGRWIGPVRCHYCGFVHARDLERDIGLELALLRSGSKP
jgi:hypothetical protein